MNFCSLRVARRSLTCAALVAFLLAALLCVNVVSAAPTAGSAKSSPAKSGAPGSAAAAAKKAAAVIEEVDVALRGQIGTVGALVCPIYKASLTPTAAPLLARRDAAYDEWIAADPSAKAKVRFAMTTNKAKMAYFGDAAAAAALEKQAASADKADATVAKLSQSLLAWWNAFEDADAQKKIFDDLQAQVTADPASDDVAAAIKFAVDTNPATIDLASRSWDVLATMKAPFAKTCTQVPNKLGKPLQINGTTVNGKPFNSAQWKGKVVMVDFWATWCPPCMAELPHVAQVYAQQHDKGLEIIGVSSDVERADFQNFLKNHADVPWPQLFVGGREWHPLTKKFGIQGIPTVYLIDRAGILRSAHVNSNLDDFIEFLLEEPADAPPAADRPIAPPFATPGFPGGWKAMLEAQQKSRKAPTAPSPASKPPATATPKKPTEPLPF
jgi:thiol-disulfide isomerase/thioredoxin